MKNKKEYEFDLINILKQKEKKEKIVFEGAMIAFKLPDGSTGTWTLYSDTGVRLRLIQEGMIQERIMELSIDELARKAMLSSSKKGGEQTYCG